VPFLSGLCVKPYSESLNPNVKRIVASPETISGNFSYIFETPSRKFGITIPYWCRQLPMLCSERMSDFFSDFRLRAIFFAFDAK
jgi:hypothetical protein